LILEEVEVLVSKVLVNNSNNIVNSRETIGVDIK
jgi:hypothetical protein